MASATAVAAKIPLISYTETCRSSLAGRPEPDPMTCSPAIACGACSKKRGPVRVGHHRYPAGRALTDAHLLSSLVHAVLLVVQSTENPFRLSRWPWKLWAVNGFSAWC